MENLSAFDERDEFAPQTAFSGSGRGARHVKARAPGLSDNIMRAARHLERERPERPETKPPQTKPIPPALEPIAAAAPVTSYNEAIEVIRARVGDRLKISYANFDALCTFPAGLTGKVFGPSQIKRFGLEKFFDAIRGAGLRIRFEEDPEQTAMILDRIKNNFAPRQANQARPCNTSHPSAKMIDNILDYLTRKKGGLGRLNSAVREARSAIALRGHATRRCERLTPRALPAPARTEDSATAA
jgi:hypothetical protein